MKKIVEQYFILTNGTGDPTLQNIFDDYQALYKEVRKNRRRAEQILDSIEDWIQSLIEFIENELGRQIYILF